MMDIIERAEAALTYAHVPQAARDAIGGLVAALKAARAENARLNGVLDALDNRIKVERLRSRDRAAVDDELIRLGSGSAMTSLDLSAYLAAEGGNPDD